MKLKRLTAMVLLALFLCTLLTGCGPASSRSAPTAGQIKTETAPTAAPTAVPTAAPTTAAVSTEPETVPTAAPSTEPVTAPDTEAPVVTEAPATEPAPETEPSPETEAPEDPDRSASAEPSEEAKGPEEAEVRYIANMNSKKFHYPDCSSVSDMKEENKWYFTGTRDELIEKGYVPCKRCNP